ncbi:GILT-like protein 2 [Chrysoperla carnea]|uniref:GILT-like protein 2 n=1 Tax=Chrysoperla carnea TaxID=189513 RepID=UPI001D082341|nr:GILT-like protein 2 [Chrysoperla carnea]
MVFAIPRTRFGWRLFHLFMTLALIFLIYKLIKYPMSKNQIEIVQPKVIEKTVERKPIIHEVTDDGDVSAPVLITVYYEALCPDSKSFVTKQLLPAYEKGARIMDVDLVPYGKATTKIIDDRYEFECQHSYEECEANKVHACVIYYIPKTLERIRYVSCMIQSSSKPIQAGHDCAKQLYIDYHPIKHCAQSEKGSELLKKHGDQTQAVRPKITFIPTVTVDNSSDISSLPALLKDLFGEVCKQFKDIQPNECLDRD